MFLLHSPVHVDLSNSVLVGQLSQFQPLLDSISAVQKCRTPYCSGESFTIVHVAIHTTHNLYLFYCIGHLVTTGHAVTGRGGSAVVHIACSGCGKQHHFASSSMSETELQCSTVSYSLRLAAFASGIGFAGYHKLFASFLGMNATSDKMFHQVIEEAYPHITSILNEVCEMGKTDGCWHIRGFFS